MKSKLAYSTAPDNALVTAWVDELGVNDAEARRRGLGAALIFFAQHMPILPIDDALGFLHCMDLSKPVTVSSTVLAMDFCKTLNQPQLSHMTC